MDTNEFKTQMKKIVESLKKELSGVRTNRPSAALLEDIKVSYYDQTMPLKQLGSVGVKPPREIHVQVWDKDAVPAVVKAIESSSLNLSPQADENVVRIFLPELSEERREELVRHIKKSSEQYRIQVRNTRDDANKEVEKSFNDNEIGEDEKFRLKESIQNIVEDTNKEIEDLLDAKVSEIMER